MLVLDTDMVVWDMDILIMVKLQLPLSIIFPICKQKLKSCLSTGCYYSVPSVG